LLFTPRHDFFSLSVGAFTRGEFQRIRMGGLAEEDGNLPSRRSAGDRELRAANFLQIRLEFLRRQLGHARRFFCDDDLRTRLTVFDEERVRSLKCAKSGKQRQGSEELEGYFHGQKSSAI